MFHSKVHIEEGDLVILYMVRTEMAAITITPGQAVHNKFGRYRHEDMIGMKYGSKMHSPAPQSGYIYLLRPTPELWTLSLPHRTQILYMTDIAYILMRLGVRVGGKVIEAGTGSGSMTHSMARAVGPKGYVGSYEYHASRYEKAKSEFLEHGLENVRLQHRNVCKDGFGDVENVEGVFLDLPAPWEAIPHVIPTLRSDMITKICCFSPCLEQVLKTVSTLREYGFSDISTQEVLIRTHELQAPPLSDSNHLKSIDEIVSDLQAHQKKKEERRIFQMRTAREKARAVRVEKGLEADPGGMNLEMELGDMLREELSKDAGVIEGEQGVEGSTKRKVEEVGNEVNGESSAKKAKLDNEGTPSAVIQTSTNIDTPASITIETNNSSVSKSTPSKQNKRSQPDTLSSQLLLRTAPEMRGHTSYLTFATFYPSNIRESIAVQGGRSTKASTPAPVPVATEAKDGPSKVTKSGTKQAPISVTDSVSETEYGDHAMEAAIGTLTEEEMVAMLGR